MLYSFPGKEEGNGRRSLLSVICRCKVNGITVYPPNCFRIIFNRDAPVYFDYLYFMFWRIVLLALVVYFVFRLIFDFIIPVYRATQEVKKNAGQMRDKMNEFMKEKQAAETNSAPAGKTSRGQNAQAGDYIDFEEIK